MIRTVTDPSGSTAVPRLLSTNSPCRWRVVGSMTSTLLEGCIASMMPVTTITAIMTRSMAAMSLIHCFSVRATTSSGTMPSGSDGGSGLEVGLANCASPHEQQEIKGQPTDEKKPDGDAGDDVGPDRPPLKRSRRLLHSNESRNAVHRGRGGLGCVRLHFAHSFNCACGAALRTCWKYAAT